MTDLEMQQQMVEIEKVYQQWKEQSVFWKVHDQWFSSGLHSAANAHAVLDKTIHADKLGFYILEYLGHHLNHGSDEQFVENSTYLIDSWLTIMLKNDIAADVLKKEDARELLARLCVHRVVLATRNSPYQQEGPIPHPDCNNFKNLLEVWACKKLDATVINSVSSVVTALYGQGALAVCNLEVQEEKDIPEYLAKVKWPLAGIENKKTISLLSSEIPDNLM